MVARRQERISAAPAKMVSGPPVFPAMYTASIQADDSRPVEVAYAPG